MLRCVIHFSNHRTYFATTTSPRCTRRPRRRNSPLAIVRGIKTKLPERRVGAQRRILGFSPMAAIGVAMMAAAAARLLNAFTAQVETMRRLRSGGTQVIRIERVELKEGGQAVIGNLKAVPSAHDR